MQIKERQFEKVKFELCCFVLTVTTADGGHVFISYQTTYQTMVKKLNSRLKVCFITITEVI